ncbi:ABC transporter ATP-binding protein [Methanospirillum stamsii]|nr:ABC transporter ATP-binding protein [Methanospirillum stamsii]
MIRFQKVFKSFSGHMVLNNLSFDIETNTVVSILGPSGIGKTTILRLISGAINPDFGVVEVTGKKIGYIFQDPRLLPWRTARDNVALGLIAEGKPKDESRRIAAGWMKKLDLEGFEDYYPGELSGGMMQRVSIGRALAIEPDILLMDEPFSNLNVELKKTLMTMLESIFEEYQTTVVYVTHDISEAVRISDKILSILPGSVTEEIQPDDFQKLMQNSCIDEYESDLTKKRKKEPMFTKKVTAI